jgi:hypothetical protein
MSCSVPVKWDNYCISNSLGCFEDKMKYMYHSLPSNHVVSLPKIIAVITTNKKMSKALIQLWISMGRWDKIHSREKHLQ